MFEVKYSNSKLFKKGENSMNKYQKTLNNIAKERIEKHFYKGKKPSRTE